MRILVCGGRDFGRLPESKPPHEVEPGIWSFVDRRHPDFPARWAERQFMIGKLEAIASEFSPGYPSEDMQLPQGIVIIAGGATGADEAAVDWAVVNWLPFEEYKVTPEEWRRLGKKAGPLRNQRMLDEGKPDLVVAFPGGTGTADMVRRARAAGVPVREIAVNPT